MAGSVHPFRLLLLAALLTPVARAQATTPPAPTPTPVSPVASDPPASPKLTKLFAGTPPKFDPPKPATSAAVSTTVSLTTDKPRNGIIRLPTYLVRGDTRLPDEYQILTPKGRDAAIAQRYMGPQNQLDRALNAVTFTDLWKSIPLLGKVPFVPFDSMSYNERAAAIYERTELKRRYNELMSVEQTALELEKPKAADKAGK